MSRGLGDVYKRQQRSFSNARMPGPRPGSHRASGASGEEHRLSLHGEERRVQSPARPFIGCVTLGQQFNHSRIFFKKFPDPTLAGVAQLVGASSHKPKGCRFDPWSGHMPGLRVGSPVGACKRQPIDVSLTSMFVSLPLSPSLPLSKHVLG